MNYDRARLAFAIKWWRRLDPEVYFSFRKNWWRYYTLRKMPKTYKDTSPTEETETFLQTEGSVCSEPFLKIGIS